MNLPRQALLKGCSDPKEMEQIIELAEKVLKTRQPTWSNFISGRSREEALQKMKGLSEVKCESHGGYIGAERQRLLIQYSGRENNLIEEAKIPIKGIRVQGNFLFDNPTSKDIRKTFELMGVEPEKIGDIWIIGDRGANVLCSLETANSLNNIEGKLRDVIFHCEEISLGEVQPPVRRAVKEVTTIEASCRVDAIASAGFGLSRSKVVKQIKDGRIQLNWCPLNQPSHLLREGDRLGHEDRGELVILTTELTKRQRWRIVMRRS